MNFSKPLVILAILGLSPPALAEAKIKSTTSNTSFRGNCQTPACCIQHPNANGCTGSQLKSQANLPRHPRDTGAQPSTVTTPGTINNSKSNTFKEKEGINNSKSNSLKEKDTTIDAGRSNTFKESYADAPPMVPADSKNSGHATEKIGLTPPIATFKEAAPTPGVTPTPKPVKAITVKGSKSNSSFREAEPTPTPKPVENKNLNSNRSN